MTTASTTTLPTTAPTAVGAPLGFTTFRAPTAVERLFNRVFGKVLGLGMGPDYNQLLEVVGRRSGTPFHTPVNVMEFDGKRYIVCPRGRAQWVRNAEATGGRVTLRRGRRAEPVVLHPMGAAERPPVLREYLRRYRVAVARYFSVEPTAETAAFAAIAEHYPTFEVRQPT